MKSNLIACLLVALLVTGCNENTRRRSVDEAAILDVSQTIEEEQEEDSPEELIEEEPMPVAADELFDDFIFNFASNRRLQLERIDFPLVINSGAKVDTVQEDEWQMERFFMQQGEYTLIFDSEAQKELVKDTSVNHAIVEKIFLDNDFIRQYLFSRKSGQWRLYEVRNQTLPKNPNASFIAFYHQFVSDSVFQRESLADEIDFSGPDPDDDFAQMEGVITPDFWDAFAPELPKHLIYNIVYGQQGVSSTNKIFLLRGIANGQETEVTFRQENGDWKLTKLTE
ncbi:MAG: DUF4348 domain-containing protein [Prevotella sp.]|nr:DUF4348 domain-containing protein [Prevotella sp.]